MIEIANETLLTLDQAAEKVLVSKATVLKWITRGVDGVKLEALKLGVHWRTSMEALQRFADRTTPIHDVPHQDPTGIRSHAQQQRHQQQVEEKLDKLLGVRKCESCRKVIEAKGVVIPKEEKLWCPDCLIQRKSATLGQRIRTFRWAAHLSQQALAQSTGIRIEKIRAFETNQSKPPNADLAKLTEVLGEKLVSGLS